MNSYEKEVMRSQLEAEKQVLLRLKAIYEQAAKDVSEKLAVSNGKIEILLQEIENADETTQSVLQSQIYQRDFQQNLKEQLDLLLKDLNDNQYASISEYLKNSYNNGFIGTLYSLNTSGIPVVMPINPTMVVRAMSIDSKLSKPLYERLGEDVEHLKKRISNEISRGISSSMHYNDIARNIAGKTNAGVNNAMRIVRTEGGRIYNAASLDSAKAAKEKTDADLVKVWDAVLDGLTRPHHRQLDGQMRELDENFEIDGLSAPAPNHFGIAKEDINCRCVVLTKPRWDVDGPFTKRDNETGELLEFQGTKSYEEFKEKYWKTVDNSGESGIIKESSKKSIAPITDNSVERVSKVKIRGYSDEQCEVIQNQHKELLKYSRDNNENKEVAFVFDNELKNRKEFKGSDDRLDFGSALYGKDLFVMHNHPRNSSYSLNDVVEFIGNDCIKTLTIVKNNGNTESLTKLGDFDKLLMLKELKRLEKNNVKIGSDSEYRKIVDKFLNKYVKGDVIEWLK